MLARIDDATQIQTRARAELDRAHPETAIQLTMRSREMAKDALAAARRPIDREAVVSALQRTDEILERLRADLERKPDEAARAILDRARERQSEAKEAFVAGEFRKALALTRVARAIAAHGAGDE